MLRILKSRFIKFCIVGGVGTLINMGLLWAFTELFGIYYLISSILAIEFSIISNFFLNEIWTWSDRKTHGRNRFIRFLKCNAGYSVGILVNVSMLGLLTSIFDINYLVSNLIAIIFSTLINFVIHDKWTWKAK